MNNPNYKLYEIKQHLSQSIYLWKKFYMPNKMIGKKERTKWKQYTSKPTICVLKVFILSDQTSNYIYNIDNYTNKKVILGKRTIIYSISGFKPGS